MTIATAFWQRLDTAGHDACRLEQIRSGWRLTGIAVFRHPDGPASLSYRVDCDPTWRSEQGRVSGFIGHRSVDHAITRDAAGWALDGAVVAGLDHLVDLDLSFTPATNLLQLRRVAVPDEGPVPLPVAWFDLGSGTLSELPQTYARAGARAYRYSAPTAGYQDTLETGAEGFVTRYPGLWQAA